MNINGPTLRGPLYVGLSPWGQEELGGAASVVVVAGFEPIDDASEQNFVFLKGIYARSRDNGRHDSRTSTLGSNHGNDRCGRHASRPPPRPPEAHPGSESRVEAGLRPEHRRDGSNTGRQPTTVTEVGLLPDGEATISKDGVTIATGNFTIGLDDGRPEVVLPGQVIQLGVSLRRWPRPIYADEPLRLYASHCRISGYVGPAAPLLTGACSITAGSRRTHRQTCSDLFPMRRFVPSPSSRAGSSGHPKSSESQSYPHRKPGHDPSARTHAHSRDSAVGSCGDKPWRPTRGSYTEIVRTRNRSRGAPSRTTSS